MAEQTGGAPAATSTRTGSPWLAPGCLPTTWSTQVPAERQPRHRVAPSWTPSMPTSATGSPRPAGPGTATTAPAGPGTGHDLDTTSPPGAVIRPGPGIPGHWRRSSAYLCPGGEPFGGALRARSVSLWNRG